MSAPTRIQLRRTKGWRKPEGAVVVSRPSLWGNPFSVADWGLERSIEMYRNTVGGIWNPSLVAADEPIMSAYSGYERFIQRLGGHPTDIARYDLAGRDLACWCPLDQPCHADVLLEIANGGSTR